MSWTNRLAELYELLIGVGVAAAVLAFVAWLFGVTGTVNRRSDVREKNPLLCEPTREESPTENQQSPALDPGSGTEPALPVVVAFYIAPSAGKPMERAQSVKAVAGRGLVGDRYFLANGHWTGTDDCEVTIIAQEDIDEIERRTVVRIQNGEHRRNMVIRNLPIENLTGKRFYIGSACFGYERPRPPCAYIQMVSEPGMTKALGRRAGICVRCIQSGEIKEGDRIVILKVTLLQALRYRTKMILRRWQFGNQGHG